MNSIITERFDGTYVKEAFVKKCLIFAQYVNASLHYNASVLSGLKARLY